MSTEAKYPIRAVAIMVGKPGPALPITTIRGWTREYAPHLSADATPPPGTERRYSERDVAVLKLIHEWRQNRIPTANIHARLQDATIPIVEVVPVDESTESPPQAPTIDSEPLQLPAVVQKDVLARLQGLESLDKRVSSLEQRNMLLLAFAVGVLVVLAIVVVWLLIAR